MEVLTERVCGLCEALEDTEGERVEDAEGATEAEFADLVAYLVPYTV